MTVEAPESIRRGEQIGLRLDIFNNWDRDLEVGVFSYMDIYCQFGNHRTCVS